MNKNDWTRLLTLLLFGKVSLSIHRSVWLKKKYGNRSNYIRSLYRQREMSAVTWNCRKYSSIHEQQFELADVRVFSLELKFRIMEKWQKICLVLCLFGLLKELRPSEPFLTQYLTGPWKNLTTDQVINICVVDSI